MHVQESYIPFTKNYSGYIYEEALSRLDFPNYHNFKNINGAYSHFI